MDVTPELERFLVQLDADPAASAELLERHAPMVADSIAKKAWAEGHECGESDGRDSDHPQFTGCATPNPYANAMLSRAVDRRFVGVAEDGDGDGVRYVLIRGRLPMEEFDVLTEAMRREHMHDIDWRWAKQESRHLIPGQTTDLGAIVTTKGEAFVEPAFAEAQPDDTVTVVTLVERARPSYSYRRAEAAAEARPLRL